MLAELKDLGRLLKEELDVYRKVLRDPRTPRSAKVLLGLAVGYLLLPFDLVPDFVPFLGQIDDMIIVPLLAAAALKRIPAVVVEDARRSVRAERA